MSPLKLKMLPDRETSKITFTVGAELQKLLEAYAEAYHREYGKREAVADLIPFMLEAYINSDKQFRKSHRDVNKQHSGGELSTLQLPTNR